MSLSGLAFAVICATTRVCLSTRARTHTRVQLLRFPTQPNAAAMSAHTHPDGWCHPVPAHQTPAPLARAEQPRQARA